MTKYKNQHFIPKCYLSAWCDPECLPKQTPYVWYFPKNGGEGKRKSPKNLFYEKNMYTIHLKNGSRDLRLEYGLNQLETRFADLRREKIEKRKELNSEDRAILCLFAAAMQGRTPRFRKHQKEQWKEALDMMDDMKKAFKTATPEQRKAMANHSSITNRNDSSALNYEDVKNIVDNTTQVLLPSFIRTAAPLLYRLDLAVLITDGKIGFITSDNPCVWFDPESYKRPPLYRSPALAYDTIEITLPISPNAILLLNRKGITGYIRITENVVDDLSRKTRFQANEYFVVNSNITKDIWFEIGEEPEDSWEKRQARGKQSDKSYKDLD